jgi:hypothetical protein
MKQCGINHESWEQNQQIAIDIPGWRQVTHTGAEHCEQKKIDHRERLRTARKSRQDAASTVPTTEYIYPVCRRSCFSRIGLHSHTRTHQL